MKNIIVKQKAGKTVVRLKPDMDILTFAAITIAPLAGFIYFATVLPQGVFWFVLCALFLTAGLSFIGLRLLRGVTVDPAANTITVYDLLAKKLPIDEIAYCEIREYKIRGSETPTPFYPHIAFYLKETRKPVFFRAYSKEQAQEIISCLSPVIPCKNAPPQNDATQDTQNDPPQNDPI